MTSIERRRQQQRYRATTVLMSIVLVAIVVVDVVAIALHASPDPRATPIVAGALPTTSGTTSPTPAASVTPVPTDVLAGLTGVSPAVESQVGAGASSILMKAVTTKAPSGAAKPTVLYVGAEFCPFCASERWSIIQALSRFGTFSGLAEIRSSEGDLATFDFATARFSSDYLSFDPVELEGEQHQQIGRLTAAQLALFDRYARSFPFLYVAGRWVQTGAGFDPAVLAGQDQRQVAAQLSNPGSAAALSIIGEANVLTAAICDTTDNQPSTACGNSAVVALQERLTGAVPS